LIGYRNTGCKKVGGAGIGQHSNGVLSNGDRFSGAVAFAAGFEVVLEPESGLRDEIVV
jgi:hypothetical protein